MKSLDAFETDRSTIEFKEEIGHGEFGRYICVCTCKMHIPKLELWMYVGLSEMIWDLMGDFPTSEVGFPLPRISKVYTDMMVLNYN